jgi:hypothetical protein
VQQNVFQFNFVEVLGTFAAKVREADLSDLVLAAQQAQAQLRLFAGRAVALFKVPFAFSPQRKPIEPFGATISPLLL